MKHNDCQHIDVDCSPHATYNTSSLVYRCNKCRQMWIVVGSKIQLSAALCGDEDAQSVIEHEAKALEALIQAEQKRA